MDRPFYAAGLKFECTQCHDCCRHDPGYVFLSRFDLERLAQHKGLSPGQFIESFCRWVDLGDGEVLSLVEKKNYDCIFWDQGCTVYSGRPLQCRAYPFWKGPLASPQAWDFESRACPGIGRGKLHSREDIEAWLQARRDQPVLRRSEL